METIRIIKRLAIQRRAKYGLFLCVAVFILAQGRPKISDHSEYLEPVSKVYNSTSLAYETNSHINETKTKDKDIVNLARKISLHNRTVLISVVNNAFLPFAYSWLCNTEDMGVHKSVLVITTDEDTNVYLTRDWPDINVFHMTLDISEGNQDYSHVGYVKMMIRRTEIILSVLRAGIEILLLEFDYTWFSNPIPALQRHTNVDMLVNPVSNTMGVYNGGFIYFFPTEPTKDVWTKVTEKMYELGKTIANKPDSSAVSEGENDQIYLSNLIREKFAGLKVELLPLTVYSDGKWYSMTKVERKKYHPVVLSNNWIMGNKNKMERAKRFGQWFINDDKTCNKDAVQNIVKNAS